MYRKNRKVSINGDDLMKNTVNTFEVRGDTIFIMRDDWDTTVETTYRDDYVDEIKNHVWRLKDGYPYNATLGGGLHRYIMSKWYGEEMLKKMTEKGYVVDHINNNHTDCRISNLEFLKRNRNVAKGQYFDKESKLMSHEIAVSIFKDFTTNYYQITIGCNAHLIMKDSDGKIHNITVIKLLYNCAYPSVILDAEKILTEYDETKQFNLANLNYCDIRVIESEPIELTDAEQKQGFIMRNGKTYLILGNGTTFLRSVNYDEGWMPNLEE